MMNKIVGKHEKEDDPYWTCDRGPKLAHDKCEEMVSSNG